MVFALLSGGKAAPAVTRPVVAPPKEEKNKDGKPKIPTIEEFLDVFREQAHVCCENAYMGEPDAIIGADNDTLSTTLPEDVYSLVNIQIDTLHEYLKVKKLTKSESGLRLVVVALLCIIQTLHNKQMMHRDRFLLDLESNCAAANDFFRMIELFDTLMESIDATYPKLKTRKTNAEDAAQLSQLEKAGSDLVVLYGNDAVFAVQRTQTFVMRSIHESNIPQELFSVAWEDELVFNEVAIAIVRTLEDYLYDYHSYLASEFLYRKVVGTLVRAVVCFYVRCLVVKADDIRRRKRKGRRFVGAFEKPFRSPVRAILRMMYDIEVFRSYFENLVKQNPALQRCVEEEISILVVIHECLALALDHTNTSTLGEYTLVLHKRTGHNVHVTKFLMKDLWLLVAQPEQRLVLDDTLSLMQAELAMLSLKIDEGEKLRAVLKASEYMVGLNLSDMLLQCYEQRILQEAHNVCAPCAKAVKKVTGRTAQPKNEQQVASLLTLDFLANIPLDKVQLSDLKSLMMPPRLPNNARAPVKLADLNTPQNHQAISTAVRDERIRKEHEKAVDTLHTKIVSNLKLHNMKFVQKTSKAFDERIAKMVG